jgi:prepilin-type N-terminal cleavage/methylation domain-containing protein
MFKTEKKGFTLIELLLVTSIISLLSTVIMAAVNEARGGARLAVIGQELDNLHKESQIYYTGRNYYSVDIKTITDCPTSADVSWGFLGTSKGIELIDSIKEMSGDVGANCATSPSSWAISFGTNGSVVSQNNTFVSVAFAQASTGFICVDSSDNVIIDVDNEGSDGDFRNRKIGSSETEDFFFCQ